jgi:uncharacterized metal-binding protein
MPSGKIHDLITYVLAAPTAVVLFLLTRNAGLAAIGTGAMLFGGLMFGPDLDVKSRQYFRWGVFRWIWIPYQKMFSHRSSWTHGLVWSTLIRIAYFTVVMTSLLAIALYAHNVWVLGMPADADQAVKVLQGASHRMSRALRFADQKMLLVAFVGLWWGAASHSISDFLGTAFKTGRKFF